MKVSPRHRRAALSIAGLSLIIVSPLHAATDLRFDYTSFESTFQQPHFNVLNYPSINGNYMMTSTDNHRPEMVANNNQLAEFYNWLTDRYSEQTVKNGAAAADVINTYTVNNSTNNGPRPTWLVLNEISSSLWTANPGAPSLSTYRTWLMDCVTRLTTHHGYKVVTLAPFQNPGQNNASWQALSAIRDSYIGIECYLSGPEVWAGGTDYDSRREWAESQYAASKQSYLNRGVPADRLFVTEHFANNATHTDSGVPIQWGRNNMASASDWDQVIMIRQDAIYNVGFDGFLAYNWGGNGMGVTQAEQLQHEYYYRTRLTLAGEQPQWLSDSSINVNGTVIPLSWAEFLNWKGGVPNSTGAIANFYRTNTAARTITLDGSKTVGVLSFNSPNSYNITAGTGGTLTINNGANTASISVPQGSHGISVPLTISSNTNIDIAGALTINNGISTSSGRTINKTGSGTLTITSSQTYASGTTFNANGGTTNINTNGSTNLTLNINASVFLNATQTLANLSVGPGGSGRLAAGSNRVINTGTFNMSGGKLNLTNNDMVVRGGTLGSWNGSAYTGITGFVQSGLGNGTWNGASGIVTTETTATTSVLTTLAVARASHVLGIGAAETGTWSGQSVNGNAVLVMYTWGGDADLNGELNGDDYFYLDSNILQNGSVFGFHNGDFNYDGELNGDDYFILDSNILQAQGSPPMGGASFGAVPEPAGLSAVVALAALGRRRRLR